MFWSGIADEAGKPLDTQIRAHKELGWKHIELRQVDNTTVAYATDAEFGSIQERLAKAGMQVTSVASAIANWARDISDPIEKDVDELRRSIPRMQALGAKFIRVMSWVNKKGMSESAWRKEAIRRLKELAKMAEDGGIVMVHENCHGWASISPENTNIAVAEVNSPAFKLVFDSGNSTDAARTTYEFYAKLNPKDIVYVHLKDMKRDGHATWPGEGDSEVERALRDLFKHGYAGGISIEPHIAAVIHEAKESNPEVMYKTYVEYGRRAMAFLKKIRG